MAFQKGVSGNPDGARGRKPITDALCLIISQRLKDKNGDPIDDELPPDATIAYELATTMVRKARSGDKDMIEKVLQRVEGNPEAKITHSGSVAVFTAELSPTFGFISQASLSGSDHALPELVQDRPVLPAPVRP